MKLTLSGNFIHPNSTNIIVTSRLIDIIKRNKHKHAIASISSNVTRCVTGCPEYFEGLQLTRWAM